MAIQFFGEIDYHPTKKHLSSEYPAWYFDRPLEQVKEESERMEREMARGVVPADKIPIYREKLAANKEKYEKIVSSIPKLEGGDMDDLAKLRKDMSKEIKDGYYTRNQMQKGLVDAHKEAERMVKPIIPVDGKLAELAGACKVRVVDGKVSRDGMVKMWKMTGKLMNYHGANEETNAEVLRRD